MTDSTVPDWTSGHQAIAYQVCVSCRQSQYFRRAFCAACGSVDLADRQASGEGTVYATALVCRAATEQTRARVPYNIVLVDVVEGFRMMAHGDATLAIGDNVSVRFTEFAGRLVPYFAKVR